MLNKHSVLRKLLLPITIGCTLSFLVGLKFEKIWVSKNEPQNLVTSNPLQKLEVDPSWIEKGNPKFLATQYYQSPDQSIRGGIFECFGPTTFVWKYSVEESIYILEGEVELSYLGKTYQLKSGDQFHFYPNTEAKWVVNSHIKKSWVMRDRTSLRDKLVRLMH